MALFKIIQELKFSQEVAEVFGLTLTMFIILCESLTVLYFNNNIIEIEKILEAKPFIVENQEEKIIRIYFERMTK